MNFDCFTLQPSACSLARTLCSESPTIKRSLDAATSFSKSAFSSGPNRSSNESLALRRRLFCLGAGVRFVFRTAGTDSDVAAVFLVLRTGFPLSFADTFVTRAFRVGTGLVDGVGVTRVFDGGDLVVFLDGPAGREADDGGPLSDDLPGGPLLWAGGPLPRVGGPLATLLS